MIYHIAHKVDWEKAQRSGSYTADSLATQGFIHCSTSTQVIKVANTFYRGVQGLVLLVIQPDKLQTEVRFENLEGGEELFPHVYGPIPLTAVINAADFPPSADGGFQFPGQVSAA